MPWEPVKFRPDHTYETRGGDVLPGISSRLRRSGLYYEFADCGFLDPAKGERVHAAVHYAVEGALDEATVDPDEYGYVRQALAWIKAEGLTDIRPEFAVGNVDLGYATKIDLFCRWRGKPACVNWKTGPVRRVYAIQSALEALLFTPEPVQRLGVHLTSEDGKQPALMHYTDRKDFEIAKAALTCSAWVDGGKQR